MHLAVLSLLIFLAALLYSSVGHAGASGYLAAMALADVEPSVMKPTALTLNIFVAIIGTIRFARAGCFHWPLFWPFAMTSIPAAFIGGAARLSTPAYRQILGVLLLVAAVNLVIRAAVVRRAQQRVATPPVWIALIVGAVIGLLAGMTGVGGGIYLSPILLLAGWADPKRTAGVSAAFILVNSAAGLAGHLASLQSLPREMPLWLLAAVCGGFIGSGLGARRLSNHRLRVILAIVLVVAGLKLMFA